MTSYIAFDLEGPLAPRDNAYDLMKLFPEGARIFEVISRYDDLLTLEAREDYEPGDTLALIVPFLLRHRITEENITALAATAGFTGGARKLLPALEISGWKICCITTTYEQYARHVTNKLGIYTHNVASTPFPLSRIAQNLAPADTDMVAQAEADILKLRPGDDDGIRQRLDRFYREQLPPTTLGQAVREVKPVGGRRKVAALQGFAEKYGQPLSGWVAVGDSITDFKMLQAVDEAGGLAIAFNANEYALPHATMSLASTLISDLEDVLAAWKKGQRKEAEKLVRAKEKAGGQGDRNHFHWLAGRENIDEVIALHRRIRQLVREEAGKLG